MESSLISLVPYPHQCHIAPGLVTVLKVKRKSNFDPDINRPAKKLNCIKLGSVRNELIKEGQDVVDDLVEEPDDILHQRQEVNQALILLTVV